MGGEIPAEGGVAPEGGAGPEEQVMAMAQQIVEQLGPEAAAMLAEAIMQMLQGAPQEAPVYARKGGKLVRVNKR